MDEVTRKGADFFKVLSSPVRLEIIRLLSERQMAVQELADAIGVSQTLVSQHLRVMRMARLVEACLDGRHRNYRVSDEHVSHIVLDALQHAREEMP